MSAGSMTFVMNVTLPSGFFGMQLAARRAVTP